MNTKLKDEIIALLNSGSNIKLKWDCGNDDRAVSIFVNDEKLSQNDSKLKSL